MMLKVLHCTDVFDSIHYHGLLRKRVIIDGQEASHTYFSDSRDIVLGLATDGFGPFKHQKSTWHWPLILFNYNIGPEARVHIDNAIFLSIIPGLKKPIDIDLSTAEWPMVEELSQLQLLGFRLTTC